MFQFKVYGNIFDYDADAIVCPSCIEPIVGVGLDRQIYELAGKEQLLEARKKVGKIYKNRAKHTSGFQLKYQYIIHVATPRWSEDFSDTEESLKKCYWNSLHTAIQLGCQSVVFPLLGSGVQGIPFSKALEVAENTIADFLSSPLSDFLKDIKLVLRTEDEKSGALVEYLNDYIVLAAYDFEDEKDDFYQEWVTALEYELESYQKIVTKLKEEEKKRQEKEAREEKERELRNVDYFLQKYADQYEAYMNLDLKELLIKFIQNTGLSDAKIAKRANVEKSTLSRILNGKTTAPSRDTIIALGFALKLNEDDFRLLLKARDVHDAFPSDKRDLLILYHIKTCNWNLIELNELLDSKELDLIGDNENGDSTKKRHH